MSHPNPRPIVIVISVGLLVCLALTAFGLPQAGVTASALITATPSQTPGPSLTPTFDTGPFTETAAAQATSAAATAASFSLTATRFWQNLTETAQGTSNAATPTPFISATPTPFVSATPTASATPTPFISATPTPFVSATPTASATPTPFISATPTPFVSATHTASATPTPFISATPTPFVSATHTASATPTPFVSATRTASVTPTPFVSATHTASATPTPFVSPTPTPFVSPTPTLPSGPDFYRLEALHTRFEDYGRPSVSPDGRLVAFAALREDNWDVYVISRLTGVLRRVGRGPQPDMAPAWSPNGRYIIYQTSNFNPDGPATVDYSVLDARHAYARTVVARNMDWLGNTPPAWAPAGSQFAFGDDGEILVGSVSTPGTFIRFTPPQRFIGYRQPAWIDNWRIVFVYGQDLVVGDTRTGTATRLPLESGVAERPLWSPVHNRIGYNFFNLNGYQLRTVGLDGIAPTTLAFVAPPAPPFITVGHSAWSPDGRFIAYHHDEHLSVAAAFNGNYVNVAPMFSLWSINPSLTDLAGLSWLPDSSGFVFRNAQSAQPGLYLARLNEGAVQAYLNYRPPTATPTPTNTPTPTPTNAYFVTVDSSATQVNVGDTVVVTANTNMGIPQYTLRVIDVSTHQEQSQTDPIFTPARPPVQTVSFGPVSWTLQAVRAGSVFFRASVNGEVSCGPGCWVFRTMVGQSGNVTVSPTVTPTPTPPCASFDFGGLVYDAPTGRGVPGAIVRTDIHHIPAVETGPDGRYVVHAGDGWGCFISRLEVEAEGYVFYSLPVSAENLIGEFNVDIPLVPLETATPTPTRFVSPTPTPFVSRTPTPTPCPFPPGDPRCSG